MPRRSGGPEPQAYERSESGGVEDATGNGVTQYGIGARGIDYIYSASTMNGTWTGFPIYDAHGNMVATIARSGSNGYAVANQQSFDAWGNTRIGSGSGCSQGYCANLGHKQDAESSLIYMRARYYEPGSGRFISEDPRLQGDNYFLYAANNPVCMADEDGKVPWQVILEYQALQAFLAALSSATDSLQVENLWSVFIAKFQKTNMDLLVGIAFMAAREVSYFTGNYVMYVLGVLGQGAMLGSESAMLCIGYSARIAWYINDIDND
jgi:RHS repeat-associated protein